MNARPEPWIIYGIRIFFLLIGIAFMVLVMLFMLFVSYMICIVMANKMSGTGPVSSVRQQRNTRMM